MNTKWVNSSLDEIQATFLRARLKELDVNNANRRIVADQYKKNIEIIIHYAISLPREIYFRSAHTKDLHLSNQFFCEILNFLFNLSLNSDEIDYIIEKMNDYV